MRVLRKLVSGLAIDGWPHTKVQHRFVSGFAVDGVGLTRRNEGPAQVGLWLRHHTLQRRSSLASPSMVRLTRPNDQHRFVSDFATDGWSHTPDECPAQVRATSFIFLRCRHLGEVTYVAIGVSFFCPSRLRVARTSRTSGMPTV